MGIVYLLHFDRPLSHAKHYLGYTEDLAARLIVHQQGKGARIMAAITRENTGFTLARTWEGDRNFERKLKRQKNSPKLCPICCTEETQKANINPLETTDLGTMIKAYRLIKGYRTQEELASIIGVSRQTIHRWETNHSIPCKPNKERLKEVIGIPL